jgi:hypothetical protein
MRFLAHADPFHEASRGMVTSVTRTDNPVPADAAESQREHGFGCFCSQTLAVVGGVEDKSGLALMVLLAEPLKANLANDPAGLTPDHCEGQPLALGVEYGLAAPFLQGQPDLGAIASLPGHQIPGDIGAGLVGVQIVKIVPVKGAQDQPRCLNSGHAVCHRAMVTGYRRHIFGLSLLSDARQPQVQAFGQDVFTG